MEEQVPSKSSISYHVFLSFRAQDTGNTFTDHLHRNLRRAGFHVFKCDDDDGGEWKRVDLKSNLENGIEQPRMSVIVVSQNYASSERCLDELGMILEQKRNYGHIVLPVFYDVDPSMYGRKREVLVKKISGLQIVRVRRKGFKAGAKLLKKWLIWEGCPCKIKLMDTRQSSLRILLKRLKTSYAPETYTVLLTSLISMIALKILSPGYRIDQLMLGYM